MTVVYADTSALMKRVVVESQSAAIRRELRGWDSAGDSVCASSLAWLEVWRSLRRRRLPDLDSLAAAAVSGIAEIPLTDAILERAKHIGPETLRSLDSIHLASALAVDARFVLTYDNRLADAAALSGFVVLSPVA